MHLKPLYLLFTLAVLLGTGAACQSKKKMPAMGEVRLSVATGTPPAFSLHQVKAEQVNGRVNVAIVANEGRMVQLNGLAAADLKAGVVKTSGYRVVYLPGGMQPACVATERNTRLELRQAGENQWEMWLQATVDCPTAPLDLSLRVAFDVPPPGFVVPQ